MAITGGFGFEYDILSGRARQWYMGKDGVRRFAHNDQPCDLQGINAYESGDEDGQQAKPKLQDGLADEIINFDGETYGPALK